MSKPKVIVDPNFRQMGEIFSDEDRARLYDLADIIWGKDEPMPEADFLAALPEAEAVVCADWHYGDILHEAKKLRAIVTVSGGFPLRLDYAQCFARHIRVLSAAPAFAKVVAEMCLGMALAACRDIASGDRAMREKREGWLHAGNIGTFSLYDKPVGIIGYGNLARELRPLVAPFGCPIQVYDPWLGDGYLRHEGLLPSTLEDVLSDTKVIFVLAAPSKENKALLTRELMERIGKDCVLVLMSRAHMVDFDALTDLVLDGRFKAAIDVFPTEPLPHDHPIRGADHAVLSAHRAGALEEGLQAIGNMVVDDLEAILRGLPPLRMQSAQPELALRYTKISTNPDDAH